MAVEIYTVVKSRYITRAEPDVFDSIHGPLRVYGEQVMFVFRDWLHSYKVHGKPAACMWVTPTGAFHMKDVLFHSPFPTQFDVAACVSTGDIKGIGMVYAEMYDRAGELLFRSPSMLVSDLKPISPLLYIRNPHRMPDMPSNAQLVYKSDTDRVLIVAYPTSKEAFIACCRHHVAVVKAKENKSTDGVLDPVKWDRPAFITVESARKICDHRVYPSPPVGLTVPEKQCVFPTAEDVDSFLGMFSSVLRDKPVYLHNNLHAF